MMIAPPKGSSINNLLKESLYDRLAILRMTNRNISKMIGMNISFEITQVNMMNIVEINLILPSKSCIVLFCDDNSSNLIICVMSAIFIH